DPVLEYMDLEVPLPTYKRPPAEWNVEDEPVTRAQAALPTELSTQLMTLQPGFSVEPFAFEPMIGNVIDFTWDARGRLWLVETQDYPNVVLEDGTPGNDRILILEDTDDDGRADRTTVFADGLNLATSLTFANGGVVVAQAPHMLFFRDTDGDDRADERTILFSGWPRSDTHGTPSNLRYGFDNRVWGSVGYNGFRGTVGSDTYDRGDFGAGYFRFEADGSSLDYIARTSNNTWGMGFSEDAYVLGSTANRRVSQHVHIPGRYYRALGVREPTLPAIEDRSDIYPVRDVLQVDAFGLYTAGSAHELYTARAFPREYWNRIAFVAEPTGHVIGMFELSHVGSTFAAKNRWSLMASRDEWAAPVQVKVGPDGALWVSDFYTLVAQHNPTPAFAERGPGNAYETPNRDKLHGRIYRIVYDDASAQATLRLDNATPAQLVAALRNDNMFWRLTAQRLIVERGQTDVVPALIDLLEDHTVDELGLNPGALHAIWTLDGLGAIETVPAARQAARDALHHPASSLRRAALQVLPRDDDLSDDLFAAGLLPERASPTAVDYTVPSAVLQDADPKVAVQALLVLSELPASARAAAAVSDMFLVPQNLRDPWIPDALAMAGANQGADFLRELVQRRLPDDSAALAGVQRAVQLMAQHHAAGQDPETVVSLIEAVGATSSTLGAALLDGIANGWPEEQPPTLTAGQRARLQAVAQAAPADLAPGFASIAERWGMPDVFRTG
ncbi:MAG TPA: PVC-type heme-binding CxxCH protein, partial [Longimicrobiales bacterium]|nr:PVC-type heme-binding CxxCH protein [Longimicrobiales bacterium]